MLKEKLANSNLLFQKLATHRATKIIPERSFGDICCHGNFSTIPLHPTVYQCLSHTLTQIGGDSQK